MVATLSPDPLRTHPDLSESDREWLQMLVGDWQLIADLALADVVLWCPTPRTESTDGFVAMAQTRPVTAPTLFHRDIVSSRARADLRVLLQEVWTAGAPDEHAEPVAGPDEGLRVRLWPVSRAGRLIAVVSVHRDPEHRAALSSIERTYLATADTLLNMVQHGRWPDPQDPPGFWIGGTPRVGDGLVVLDREGVAVFASPNALSALRRLGISGAIDGQPVAPVLGSVTAGRGPQDEDRWSVITGQRGGRIELQAGRATVTVRSIALRGREGRRGALLLLRDVTELRRQEQRLVSKDATIREIHHRVKNNLQTVGSLLRMQARRAGSPEVRRALEQAMQRVDTIALVHQSLSEETDGHVDVDHLMARQFRLAVEVAGDGRPLTSTVHGTFGALPTEVTTALALVVNELASNAVEHGTGAAGGHVELAAVRHDTPSGDVLEVTVTDSGAAPTTTPGLEAPAEGLGLRIVQTLVVSELRGSLEREAHGAGTRVRVRVPLDEAARGGLD
ncbi:MAG: sensor histidine kinase [Micrococcus sp.]|nr:sensor histidine kinase [Micrococcus sp.]